MKGKTNTIYIDLDGTLCPIKADGERYEDLPANEDVVRRLIHAREDGYKVVVYTARNMRTFDGEIASINIETAPVVLDWLKRRNIPFDGLILGKPWPGPNGFYVDDRTLRPDEFVRLDDKGIHVLLKRAGSGGT